jgi:hypothetical protein
MLRPSLSRGRKVGMNAKSQLKNKFDQGDRNPWIEGIADYENLARLFLGKIFH